LQKEDLHAEGLELNFPINNNYATRCNYSRLYVFLGQLLGPIMDYTISQAVFEKLADWCQGPSSLKQQMLLHLVSCICGLNKILVYNSRGLCVAFACIIYFRLVTPASTRVNELW